MSGCAGDDQPDAFANDAVIVDAEHADAGIGHGHLRRECLTSSPSEDTE